MSDVVDVLERIEGLLEGILTEMQEQNSKLSALESSLDTVGIDMDSLIHYVGEIYVNLPS